MVPTLNASLELLSLQFCIMWNLPRTILAGPQSSSSKFLSSSSRDIYLRAQFIIGLDHCNRSRNENKLDPKGHPKGDRKQRVRRGARKGPGACHETGGSVFRAQMESIKEDSFPSILHMWNISPSGTINLMTFIGD